MHIVRSTLMAQYTVLCVDDDESMCELYEAAFAAWGHRAQSTMSPVQALKTILVEGERFDAVLLDYEMPAINGAELAAEIRKIRPSLPLILTSGNAYIMQAAPPFVDLAIPKGSDLASLISQIEDLIAIRRKAKSPNEVRWTVSDAASA